MRPVGALPNRFRYHACVLASAKTMGTAAPGLGALPAPRPSPVVRWIDCISRRQCMQVKGRLALARGFRKRAPKSHRIRAQPDAVGLGGINVGLLQLRCAAAAAAPTLSQSHRRCCWMQRSAAFSIVFPPGRRQRQQQQPRHGRIATANSRSENSCTRPSGLRKDALATGLLVVRFCPHHVSLGAGKRTHHGTGAD